MRHSTCTCETVVWFRNADILRYVRLFLRKTSAWHRINGLGYHSDIADLDTAITDLQASRRLPPSSAASEEFPEYRTSYESSDLHEKFAFAEGSELIRTLDEASTLLKLDELKVLAKDARVQGKTKKDLISNLRRTSRSQVGLKAVLRRSDTEQSSRSNNSSNNENRDGDSVSDIEATTSDLDENRNRDAYYLKKILEETGPCIRLSLKVLRLFERVHLVFYRSTEWTEKSLTVIILARISRRNFPKYVVSRSASVFGTRALLMEFETSLRTQFRVDNILEFNGKPSEEGLQEIVDVFEEVSPRWRVLLKDEYDKENILYQSGEGAYLRRLSPAWVYTRIIHKATTVFAKLKMFKKEHDVLSELLRQKLFHHARRGAWYQRKALIEEHYMANLAENEGRNDDTQTRFWKRIALATCEEGIRDPLVHLIYHHDLQKRISKLERACKIPKREQHDFSHVRLAAPIEVTVYGVRKITSIDSNASTSRRVSSDSKTDLRGTKTIWLDPLETDGECSVEEMCLSHYRSLGWKGYHCEGRIVRTLFAYLFFDILFLYVPNVFQTPFQTCPLDLHTDAFYPCRISEINHRLAEIENGVATDLIKKVWTEHFEKETCVIGLDWSYSFEDLIEIAALFNGQALASICKVLVQDYGSRGGGMPDLFLWHPEQKEVKFSEVKSENDRLSDTQRLWIDVLTSAGLKVELCHAVAKTVVK
jgi:fanconi-associated nuclease 1